MNLDAVKPLDRWAKIGLAAFLVFLLGFGCVVELRSAFLERRMGDLDVFLRAAWAVRNGEDLYAIASENDWHYLYPPLYAILMTPLADPPPTADPAGYLPYAVSVAVVYLLNLVCLFLAAHVLAKALEARAGFAEQPRFCLRWWALRAWPILICFLPTGHTLMRGQVNVIVLATLCAALAGWLNGHHVRAGLWLSLAICIKVIPAFLLVYPLWKRDGRALVGCGVGLFVGIVAIPGLAFGPEKAVAHYETYGRVFFGPFFGVTNDKSRAEEILGDPNSSESVGVRNALHNWMYRDVLERPADLHPAVKVAYLLLGIAMTFVTLWPRNQANLGVAQSFGGLIVLMAIFSPVCHSHYLLFCLPIVMALLASAWRNQPTVRLSWPLIVMFTVFVGTMAIAYLPGLEVLKDRCASLFATLPLWAVPVAQLWRQRSAAAASVKATRLPSREAA